MSSEQKEKTVVYHLTPARETTKPASGVWCTWSAQGVFTMNFFFERRSLPQTVTHKLLSDGVVGEEISREGGETSDEIHIEREITAPVVTDYESIKIIHKWIGNVIDEYEKLKK